MKTDYLRCDSCGQVIIDEHSARVEWLVGESGTPKWGLRLVHLSGSPGLSCRCCYDSAEVAKDHNAGVSSKLLVHCIGPDGLMNLLYLVVEGELPQQDVLNMISRIHRDVVIPENDVIETIKVKHVPGYKKAKPYFSDAIAEKVIEPNMGPGLYSQEQIKAVLCWARKQGRVK